MRNGKISAKISHSAKAKKMEVIQNPHMQTQINTKN